MGGGGGVVYTYNLKENLIWAKKNSQINFSLFQFLTLYQKCEGGGGSFLILVNLRKTMFAARKSGGWGMTPPSCPHAMCLMVVITDKDTGTNIVTYLF